jgi:luciferase family oxidoreductase group 1
MPTLSVLDLAPIPEGSDAAGALRNSLDLARHAETWGYRRYWLAEHHNMDGMACSATAVLIAHIAAGTEHIRIGSGGIMLPNHAPLVVAEQFGTLATLHPDRIDLGLGRAPGTDQMTMRALRRGLGREHDFIDEVVELQSYFDAPAEQAVRAIPGAGLDVPIWILGSSLYGAQVAAVLGLPYAFASHFAPALLMQALAAYRQHFRPSARWPKPHVMLGVNAVLAETDSQARSLYTSLQLRFHGIRRGQRGPLPRPVADIGQVLSPAEIDQLGEMLAVSLVGSPSSVRAEFARLVQQTGADELMVTSPIHDHHARLRSYELLSGVAGAA